MQIQLKSLKEIKMLIINKIMLNQGTGLYELEEDEELILEDLEDFCSENLLIVNYEEETHTLYFRYIH